MIHSIKDPSTSDDLDPSHKARSATKSKTSLVYEPEILGDLNGTAAAFFPDNQSAHDIVSHDYAKRNHLKINSSM